MVSASVTRWSRAVVWLFLLWFAGGIRVAHAGAFGLVAGGDEAKQPLVETDLAPWLTANGHADVKVGTAALAADHITAIVNCFILADQACGQPHVAAGKLDGLLFVMVEVDRDSPASAGGDRIKITGWLYGPGGAPIAAQSLFCNDCRNDTLAPKLEELARLLFSAAGSGTGRLAIVTRPAGATILVDGEKVGTSPLTRGLREGPHTITVELTGHETVTRKVEIKNDAESPLDVQLSPIGGGGGGGGGGHGLAYAALGVGGAAVIGGAALILLDPRCEKGSDASACAPDKQTYTSTQVPGIITAGVGVAVVAGGVYLLTRGGKHHRATPVAAATATGAYVGLAGAF
ncbi:MAG TPA: PEGA domain-containing protein [Kofleriaceae bacterium]|nr:PEGA domain-containing protein [Kofleriaceae bacterium]